MSRFNQDQISYYLTLGIASAKNDEVDQARYYLERVLRMHPEFESRIKALLWLSQVSTNDIERRSYLEQVLVFDPTNPSARRELAILDGRLSTDEIIDVEQIAASTSHHREPEQVRSRRFVCPSCGGQMHFDPGRNHLACQYCGRSMTEAEAAKSSGLISTEDFFAAMARGEGHRWQQVAYSVRCQSCGATTVLGQGEFSKECPFCGSPQVVDVQLDEDVIEPHGIIPFTLPREEAATRFREWLGAGWFRPDDLMRQAKAGRPRGAYLPFWVFDFIGSVKWNAMVQEGNDWVPINDVMSILEDDILVPATHTLPAKPLQALDDFSLAELEPYTPEKIAAWPAEVYQISMSDASLVARTRVKAAIETRIAERYLGDRSHHSLNVSTHMVNVDRFQHILLPIWIISYHYGDQLYHVLVNGQSGEVEGEAPTNRAQVALLSVLGFAVVAVVMFLIFLILSN